MSFSEQMANIGSEVSRALNWAARQDHEHSRNAFERALELTDMTLDHAQGMPRLKEVARMREAMVDFFAGSNQFGSTEDSWRRYFMAFAYAARRGA